MIWLPVVGHYADVDVYASIIAYTDLLNQRGKSAKAYIPFAPNYSVPDSLRLPDYENASFNLQPDDEAIILDVSIPSVINRLVPDHQILELIDHHSGYEDYWHQRIGNKAIIEPIGAVATSIFEWWGECWDYTKMSPDIAKLLLAAILDNTLNFNATITTTRDHAAAKRLAEITCIDLDAFTTEYFTNVSQTLLTDLETSLLNDCKTVNFPDNASKIVSTPSNNQPKSAKTLSSNSAKNATATTTTPSDFAFAQLTLWDGELILPKIPEVHHIMNHSYQTWLVSILSISTRQNFFLTNSPNLSQYLSQLLNLRPNLHTNSETNHIANAYLISDHLLLRKEIITKLQNSTK